MKVVIKLGGSVLDKPEGIVRAARVVEKEMEKGLKPVLVVSAVKGVTDDLLNSARTVNPGIGGEELDEILLFGEVMSARLVTQALRARGIEADYLDPFSPHWPIITNDSYGDADPILEKCRRVVKEKIAPLVEERVLVICGFLGKTVEGKITTLGRGGSDTTAVVLASCLGSEEVVIVKDVRGLYSGDPREIENPVLLERMNSEEMLMLSRSGAGVLQAKALKYLEEGMRIRLVTLEEDSIAEKGSIIYGSAPAYRVDLEEKRVSMITVLLDGDKSNIFGVVAESVAAVEGEIVSASTLGKAVILYVRGVYSDIIKSVHGAVVLGGYGVAVSGIREVAMLRVSGRNLEETPGVLQRFIQPLSERGINILGVQTVHSDIALFVGWEDGRRALRLLEAEGEAMESA